MKRLAPIYKVDEEKRLVIGRAAQEVPDRSGEVMDYATAVPAFRAWSDEQRAASGGKSVGNLRAMHGSVAAGKITDIDFNDADKAVDIIAKVTDDAEWSKVLDGVYTGFSIGGSYAKRWQDGDLTRYTPAISEISLVDRPAIPTACIAELVKANGSSRKLVLKGADMTTTARTATDTASAARTPGLPPYGVDDRRAMAASGEALPDGSFPIRTRQDLKNAIAAYGRARDKLAARRHIAARALALGASDLVPDDWDGTAAAPADSSALAAAAPSAGLRKAGRAISAASRAHLDAIHKAAGDIQDRCAQMASADDDFDGFDGDDDDDDNASADPAAAISDISESGLASAKAVRAHGLRKANAALAADLARVTAERDSYRARWDALPQPAKGALRTVTKQADAAPDPDAELKKIADEIDALPESQRAAAMIKFVHRTAARRTVG